MRSVGYLITAIIAVIAGPRVGILPLLCLRMEPAAATVRTGFQDQLVGELKVDQPIELAFLPDGCMLVASQGGKLWVGSATDPEDPQVPDESLEWKVLQHHNGSHTHNV